LPWGNNVTAGNGTVGSGQGDGSLALGLIDDVVTITTRSQVTGIQSMGIFMGDQDGLVVSANNQLSLLGGKMVIDSTVPATNLVADTELEIDGTLKISSGGEACDASRKGAIQYLAASDTFQICSTAGSWTTLGGGAATPIAFSATRSTASSGADPRKIDFTAEDFDTANAFDLATNDRFTPTVAGKYTISLSVQGSGFSRLLK